MTYQLAALSSQINILAHSTCSSRRHSIPTLCLKYELVSVFCGQSLLTPGIKFNANGNFHASYVHSDLDNDKTEKDSIYISVGQCSVMEGSLISGNN